MKGKEITIGQKKNIALVAHDNKKGNLLEWVKFNKITLQKHKLLQQVQQVNCSKRNLILKLLFLKVDH